MQISDEHLMKALRIAQGATPVGAGDGNTYVVSPPTLAAMRAALEAFAPAILDQGLAAKMQAGEIFTLGKVTDLCAAARRKALEEAAKWHDRQADHERSSMSAGMSYGASDLALDAIAFHESSAAAIRAIKGHTDDQR